MDNPDKTITPGFSKERMQAAFEKAHNVIQRYRPVDIAMTAAHIMNSDDKSETSLCHYPPHLLMLLIKWGFLYGNYSSASYVTLTLPRFNLLVNLIHDFDGTGRPPTDEEELLRFLMTISHQQFSLQLPPNQMFLARPYLLFEKLNHSQYVRDRFEAVAGVPLHVFLNLSLALTSLMVRANPPQYVTHASLEKMGGDFTKYLSAFLQCLSLRPDEVAAYLKRDPHRHLSLEYELREETPFRRKPLLKIKAQYYPYSRKLLCHSLRHYAYDTLRDDDTESFMAAFGPIFEAYVGLGLSGTGVNYLVESEMRNQLPKGSKVVDYLLMDDECNVLVDAKGVEMHHLGQVSPSSHVIEDKLQSSILRGVLQGNELVGHLPFLRTLRGYNTPAKATYLVLVTYKPMYIGKGTAVALIIGHDGRRKFQKTLGDPQPIPWEHIYILSVDDWDLLVGALEKKVALGSIFGRGVALDARWETKRWEFSQHLIELVPNLEAPRHIPDSFKQLCSRVIDQVNRFGQL